MNTDANIEQLAFDFFAEVHRRLGHESSLDDNFVTREVFDSLEPRKRAWTEIARTFVANEIKPGRWLDDIAFELFKHVHERLADGYTEITRASFNLIEPRRRTWCEIARLFDERHAPAGDVVATEVST